MILFIDYLLRVSEANLSLKWVVKCIFGPFSIFLAYIFGFYYFFFHEWAFEKVVQALVKNTHNQILFFPPKLGLNETNFVIKWNIGIYTWIHLLFYQELLFACLLFCMKSNFLYVLINLMAYYA